MKKTAVLLSLLLCAVLLCSCAGGDYTTGDEDAGRDRETIELTLSTFPVGNWGNPTTVAMMLNGFHKENPDIHITLNFLTYESGDGEISRAAAAGELPDLVLEGPERLVAGWGDKGMMADISDLWEEEQAARIYDTIRDACRHRNGAYYEYPICMSAHCMAINYDMFREAGALEFIDERTHTWTAEGFINAVHALTGHGQESAGVIYCKNQSGDQGTRALVNNLYGGTFADGTHSFYTVDSMENIKALQTLYDLEGVTFEPEMTANDAINLFCEKGTAMCFCWNSSVMIQQTINRSGLDFEVFPMAFPAESGTPRLQGGIWGLGIFDSGSEERIEASKDFIRYITGRDSVYARAVLAASYWPVRDMENDIYENDIVMTEYSVFMPYMGDYYQITSGWADARTAWWQMLGKIGEGMDAAEAVKDFPSPE